MDGLKPCRANNRRLRVALIMAALGAAFSAHAGTLEQAKRIYDRLTGTPPSATELSTMQPLLASANAVDHVTAAYTAINTKAFYNATLKNWATPWTNRDDNKFAPLNDYTATVIGIIRDDKDYRQVLYGDILYVPNPSYGAYSNSNNNTYVALENADGDMSNASVLQEAASQSSVTGLPSGATAGIVTTRAAARAFFIDGTNRAMFRFTLKNHLCNDLEQVQDITRPADRIRQDVSRSPGGDSRIFMNTCIGCHSGMDPMVQAFAYYNFHYDDTAADQDAAKDAGNIEYTPGVVQPKYFINANHFPEGYVTPDDHWNNYWRAGPDTAIFGWDSGLTGSGTGAKSMMTELANSEAFAVCSVKKVFKAVCLRDANDGDRPDDANGNAGFNTMLADFKSGHNLKKTFAQAAVYCSGN